MPEAAELMVAPVGVPSAHEEFVPPATQPPLPFSKFSVYGSVEIDGIEVTALVKELLPVTGSPEALVLATML